MASLDYRTFKSWPAEGDPAKETEVTAVWEENQEWCQESQMNKTPLRGE